MRNNNKKIHLRAQRWEPDERFTPASLFKEDPLFIKRE